MLKDYAECAKKDPGNLELKDKFLEACYLVYLQAGGSEIKLKFLSYNEGISFTTIRQNAVLYMINKMGHSKQSYPINVVIDYLRFRNYCFDDELLSSGDINQFYNEKLYKSDIKYLTSDNRDKFIYLVFKIKQVICLIKNGVRYNDCDVREFDIIDFCQLLKMDLIFVEKICKFCNFKADDVRALKHFIGVNNFDSVNYDVLKFIEGDEEIYCKKDLNGKLLLGSGIKLSKSEKEKIVDYLKEYNVPLNYKNLIIASKRYINNTLFTSSNNNKTLRKINDTDMK